ncbi:MAG TPA: thioredoxin family protein [bacterium]|nr:thioredoxin family protein [bacterium]
MDTIQSASGERVRSIRDIRKLIASYDALLLYFSTPECQVCKALKPKVQHLLQHTFPHIQFRYVNLEHVPAAAAEFGVFTVPVILVYFRGKEVLRKARYLGLYELEFALSRLSDLYFD